MDLRKIRKLIEIFNASNLGEMEIRNGDECIRLTSVAAASSSQPTVPLPAVETAPSSSIGEVGSEDSFPILSPMVGTFYAATSPQDSPLVAVGDKVSVGQPICFIEAMKIFNQIESDESGMIVSVLKDDGDPVEFGEALFLIRE